MRRWASSTRSSGTYTRAMWRSSWYRSKMRVASSRPRWTSRWSIRPQGRRREPLARQRAIDRGRIDHREVHLRLEDATHGIEHRSPALLDREEVVHEAGRWDPLGLRGILDESLQVRHPVRTPHGDEYARARVRHRDDRPGRLLELGGIALGAVLQGVREHEDARMLIEPTAAQGIPHGRDAGLALLHYPRDLVRGQQVRQWPLSDNDYPRTARRRSVHHDPPRQISTTQCARHLPVTRTVTVVSPSPYLPQAQIRR